jgi:hypothetical protein
MGVGAALHLQAHRHHHRHAQAWQPSGVAGQPYEPERARAPVTALHYYLNLRRYRRHCCLLLQPPAAGAQVSFVVAPLLLGAHAPFGLFGGHWLAVLSP